MHLWERSPAPGGEALEWFLLTTLQVSSLADAERALRWYRLRWRIEDWHRILKSGCQVESLGHRTSQRLMRAVTIKAVIAWRLALMTLLGRTTPEMPASVCFTPQQLRVLRDFATHHRLDPAPQPRSGGAHHGDSGRLPVPPQRPAPGAPNDRGGLDPLVDHERNLYPRTFPRWGLCDR